MDSRLVLGATIGAAATLGALASRTSLLRSRRTVIRGRTVRHIVQLAFNDGAPIAQILAGFDEMCTSMPELVMAYERGEQCSPEAHTKGLTHIFVLTFASPAARDAYLPHPAHEEFGRTWIAPHMKGLQVSDYEIEHELTVEDEAPWWRVWA